MSNERTPLRIAATADLHCGMASRGGFAPLFAAMSENADVILLGGDLTHHGLVEEAAILAKELQAARGPTVLAVLGNHDFQSGRQQELVRVLDDAGVGVLDGDSCTVKGVGFAGVRGFGGGFGPHLLAPWGEQVVKDFVNEAVQESLKLEIALSRLREAPRVALLHYAPIVDTVVGEPADLFPFLGCSRFEEPLAHFGVSAVIHGHAHWGSPEGRIRGDIPVYNVSAPLLRRLHPDRPPFRLIEI